MSWRIVMLWLICDDMILFCSYLAVFCLPWLMINLGMQDFLVLQRFLLFFVAAKKWKVFIRLIFDKKNSENIFSFLQRNEKNLRCYEEIFQRKKKFGRIDSRCMYSTWTQPLPSSPTCPTSPSWAHWPSSSPNTNICLIRDDAIVIVVLSNRIRLENSAISPASVEFDQMYVWYVDTAIAKLINLSNLTILGPLAILQSKYKQLFN